LGTHQKQYRRYVYLVVTKSMVAHSPKEGHCNAKEITKVVVRRAAANHKKLPKKSASAVAKGAAYGVLAGRPSKQAVTAVFGKTG
jgi:hypothetical protein